MGLSGLLKSGNRMMLSRSSVGLTSMKNSDNKFSDKVATYKYTHSNKEINN